MHRRADARISSFTKEGALAQLVERLLCKQDVVGSIPSGSTIFANCPRHQPRVAFAPNRFAVRVKMVPGASASPFGGVASHSLLNKPSAYCSAQKLQTQNTL